MGEIIRACVGVVVFLGLAWLISENRRAFVLRPVLAGLAIQIVLALALTRLPIITSALGGLAHGVDSVQSSASAGATFVFGYLGGGPQPFVAAQGNPSTFIFGLQVLPAVLLVSALAALLWHWGVLRWIIRIAARSLGRVMGVSGPVGVSSAACIFLGMVEAPLLVRPLLPKLSRGEMFIIMVDGLSVIAGSTMILLGTMLAPKMPDAFGHLLTASLISTPMAIVMARIIVPSDVVREWATLPLENPYRSALDAMTHGTINAVKVAAYVIAMLIVFIGALALIDKGLALVPTGGAPLSVSAIFGWLFAPVAWLMGVSVGDFQTVGALLGTKIAANEVVAYGNLLALPAGALSAKSQLVVTYALCSFGNFGSIAILIGTLSAMAPEKAEEVVQLGPKALIAAFLTTCMTGTVVGLLHSIF
ncbi:nucleoside transporter C-terminal domain-containing protein [Sphingobium sp. CR2-8]|uniref:NupC/NupG family nucleoside CNT transporter n=1 Tax=Sphingobium sp. CR2-8 TaxID=1306534 RepID=UPI002DB60992|nr:nucleoside transporter C-terminal domain-containing protein [Sphingobium sp. CR2-8]MEC3909801.1 nucleoside transporter C-terminal domain-containing protein [Sphingobium sp. CR2-8]